MHICIEADDSFTFGSNKIEISGTPNRWPGTLQDSSWVKEMTNAHKLWHPTVLSLYILTSVFKALDSLSLLILDNTSNVTFRTSSGTRPAEGTHGPTETQNSYCKFTRTNKGTKNSMYSVAVVRVGHGQADRRTQYGLFTFSRPYWRAHGGPTSWTQC